MALGRNPMVDAHRFTMVPRPDVPRSAFDIRWFHKTTFQASTLIPVYVDEVLPGDSHRVKMNILARLATPIVPVMDNLELESWFFFVPNRLLWQNWERFMGEQASPTDSTQFLTPTIPVVAADCAAGTIGDYFGLTVNNSVNTTNVIVLPFRAYNLIWNDWFRDEDLQTKMAENTGDGPDVMANYGMQPLGKKHDYFTSARPWPQKPMQSSGFGFTGAGMATFPGGPMVFPQSGAPVSGLGVDVAAAATAGPGSIHSSGNRTEVLADYVNTGTVTFTMKAQAGAATFPDVRVLVNDIRTANMVQLMMERSARGGSRYTELVRSHFGVVSPDARLQRPEFLGGGRTMITVNPVAQTSASGATGTTTKLGQLAAAAYVAGHGHGFSHSFTEHGYILGFVGVRADLTYQQGVNRMWRRRTQFDFYWPSLAHLGEQAVMSSEIFCDGSASDLNVFGYQERWAEYRTKPSRTSGFFRSTDPTPIDMWHFAEKFASRPTLGSSFVADATVGAVTRSLQTTAPYTSQIMADMMFDVRLARPLPMFSVPGIGGRL